MNARRHLVITWKDVLLAAALAVLLLVALGGCAAPGVRQRPEQDVRTAIEPVVETLGDVRQDLRQVQQTVSEVRNTQQSQAVELAGQIRDVGEVVQNVRTQMYDIGPQRLKLEQERLGQQSMLHYQLIGVLVGVLFIALAAPAVGGTFALAFYVAGVLIIVMSIAGPIFLSIFQ